MLRWFGAPEPVDGLGVVPDGHDIAVPFREEGDDVRLDPVRILELVHHDIAIPGRDLLPHLFIVEGELQIDEEVVVVEAVVPPLVVGILFLHGLDLARPVVVIAVHLLDGVVDGHILVDADTEDRLQLVLLRELLVLVVSHLVAAAPDRLFRVAFVVYGEGAGETEGLAVAPEDLAGKGVEGASIDLRAPGVVPRCPLDHLLGASAGEGEKQDRFGVDIGLHKVEGTVFDDPRLAASRPRDDEDRPFRGRYRLVLGRVELCSEMLRDVALLSPFVPPGVTVLSALLLGCP